MDSGAAHGPRAHDDDGRCRIRDRRAARGAPRRRGRRLEPRDGTRPGQVQIPGWLFIPLLAAVGVAFLTVFSPELARFTGPVYAILEGLVLGAISRVYEEQWNGIVLQAVAITVFVLAAMAFLYATRIIKVTDRFRRIVVGAMLGLFVFYGISLLLSLFSVSVPLIWDSGPFGILFSVAVCGLAAFNLALDFDLAERGVQAGLPKQYGVVLRLRAHGLARVALPGGAAAPRQAAQLTPLDRPA